MSNRREIYSNRKANITLPKGKFYLVGFTLVELLVTVSILTIGIVLVLRSFLSVSGALSRSNRLFGASQYLEEKIADIEEETIKEGGAEKGRDEGEFMFEGCKFSWYSEIEELKEEQNLTKLFFDVTWREGNRERNISLTTYLENKTVENKTE